MVINWSVHICQWCLKPLMWDVPICHTLSNTCQNGLGGLNNLTLCNFSVSKAVSVHSSKDIQEKRSIAPLMEGWDSSVGVARCYRMEGLGTESRWGDRFSISVQIDPGAHPASYTVGTESLSWGYSGRCVALTTHPHLVQRLKNEYSYTCITHLDLHDLL